MTQAGLVEPRRASRNIFYIAVEDAVPKLTNFLQAFTDYRADT